jgi:phospholipase/carboxylesterase
MHSLNIQSAGKALGNAEKVLIMIHGRGASAGDILRLAPHLSVEDYALSAPQATNHTWYPFSFMAQAEQNEPWLTSALDILAELVRDINDSGIKKENIYFLGFSQGACLTLEYVTRNATRYGGIVAFTGGLIGEEINLDNYSGDFAETPVFIGTGNPDPHVPVKRVLETQDILKKMNAKVMLEIYNNKPHSISPDEIDQANAFVFKV